MRGSSACKMLLIYFPLNNTGSVSPNQAPDPRGLPRLIKNDLRFCDRSLQFGITIWSALFCVGCLPPLGLSRKPRRYSRTSARLPQASKPRREDTNVQTKNLDGRADAVTNALNMGSCNYLMQAFIYVSYSQISRLWPVLPELGPTSSAYLNLTQPKSG
jgi:hypothetical protein